MYLEKVRFFDTQATESWARTDYTFQEIENLQQTLVDAGISPGMNIFEPGCGTGRLTELLSRQIGPHGDLVALDMSQGMIEVCRDRLTSADNVRLTAGVMEDIDLPLHHFDAVICHNVFHHFADKLATLRKMAETIKPDGNFIIHHFLPFSEINNPARKTNAIVAQDLMPTVDQMQSMFSFSGLKMTNYSDGDDGYIVRAVRC